MVTIKNIKDYLVEYSFFKGMDEAYIDLIANCGKFKSYQAGDFLMREGEQANHFFIIRGGDVSIESFCPTKGPIIIAKEDQGSIVGHAWLFPPYRIAFDFHALTPVQAIEMDGACLRAKAEQDHQLGYELMLRFAQLMQKRLNATRLQLLDVYREADGSISSGA